MSAVLVLTTTGTEMRAGDIARQLVERRLAACVSIVPISRSIYRWKGEICDEGEFLLLIKSTQARYSELAAAILEIHDYAQPEILRLDVAAADAGYLSWLADAVVANDGPDAAG